jgi:hypothetical protein
MKEKLSEKLNFSDETIVYLVLLFKLFNLLFNKRYSNERIRGLRPIQAHKSWSCQTWSFKYLAGKFHSHHLKPL